MSENLHIPPVARRNATLYLNIMQNGTVLSGQRFSLACYNTDVVGNIVAWIRRKVEKPNIICHAIRLRNDTKNILWAGDTNGASMNVIAMQKKLGPNFTIECHVTNRFTHEEFASLVLVRMIKGVRLVRNAPAQDCATYMSAGDVIMAVENLRRYDAQTIQHLRESISPYDFHFDVSPAPRLYLFMKPYIDWANHTIFGTHTSFRTLLDEGILLGNKFVQTLLHKVVKPNEPYHPLETVDTSQWNPKDRDALWMYTRVFRE